MRLPLILLFLAFQSSLFAQDTLRLSVSKADSLFLQRNLLLLAEKYQIESSKAYEAQAKLWDNPNLSFELSLYNPAKGFADIGKQGQKVVSIQQLISTAGKRNKRIAMAAEVTKMTEFEFYDLLRNLKYQLRQRYFESYFLNQTVVLLNSQLFNLSATINAFDKEYDRNNVSLKEVVRLKALQFKLSNNRADLLFEIIENQRDMQNLLQVNETIVPIISDSDLARYNLNITNYTALEEKALSSRSDLLIANANIKQAEINQQLQKALAIPDLQIGAVYDQASNYVQNYFGFSAAIDLPLFNKNQGNIKAAKSKLLYYKVAGEQKKYNIINEVNAAIHKVKIADETYQKVEGKFKDQFEQLNKGMYENFQKRNITLLEFIDFIESYNDSILEFNRLQSDRIMVFEELNYVVGEELFN